LPRGLQLPSQPLSVTGQYQLILLGDRGTYWSVENLEGFYAMHPAEMQTHDLLISSPMLYWQCHHATSSYLIFIFKYLYSLCAEINDQRRISIISHKFTN